MIFLDCFEQYRLRLGDNYHYERLIAVEELPLSSATVSPLYIQRSEL